VVRWTTIHPTRGHSPKLGQVMFASFPSVNKHVSPAQMSQQGSTQRMTMGRHGSCGLYLNGTIWYLPLKHPCLVAYILHTPTSNQPA